MVRGSRHKGWPDSGASGDFTAGLAQDVRLLEPVVLESVARSRESMPAHLTEGVLFLIVEVVCDLEPRVVDFNEIERISFTFSTAAVP